jgi:hypothetical protein
LRAVTARAGQDGPAAAGRIEPGRPARYAMANATCVPDGSSMIRFVFRFIGFWILAGGFIALVYDGTKSIAGNALSFTPVGQIWANIHTTSLQLLQPAIERHIAVWLWDPVVLGILTAPAWLVFGILGAILMLIGRKKKPLIGYARD